MSNNIIDLVKISQSFQRTIMATELHPTERNQNENPKHSPISLRALRFEYQKYDRFCLFRRSFCQNNLLSE